MTKRVYLDNSATTPVVPEVLEAMMPYFAGEYGNASSLHAFGQAARQAVEKSREEIADTIGSSPSEIVFTSGATRRTTWRLRGFSLRTRRSDTSSLRRSNTMPCSIPASGWKRKATR